MALEIRRSQIPEFINQLESSVASLLCFWRQAKDPTKAATYLKEADDAQRQLDRVIELRDNPPIPINSVSR